MTGPEPEAFDAAARSEALAAALTTLLPARPRLLDIAPGSLGLFRWLAPRLARPQAWSFVADDTDALDEALVVTARWAERRGWTATFPARAMLLHTPQGAWRITGLLGDALDRLARTDADAIVSTGLLPSAAHLATEIARLGIPLLATLIPDGRDRWRPGHPADAAVLGASRRAAGVSTNLPRLLAAVGLLVRTAPTDWRVGAGALTMLDAVVAEAAEAALGARPGAGVRIAAWRAARRRQTLAGQLAITVGHRDILAFPASLAIPGGR